MIRFLAASIAILAGTSVSAMEPPVPPDRPLTLSDAVHVDGQAACGRTLNVIVWLRDQWKEKPVSMRIQGGEVYALFANFETGSWTTFFTLEDQTIACLHATGNYNEEDL